MKTKKVTMYISDDGRVKSEKKIEVQRYEKFVKFAQKILAKIPYAIDNRCDFANGEGFIQHNKKDIDEARFKLNKYYPNADNRDGNPLHLDLWCRLNWRIDKNYKEWGQEYYAAHNNNYATEWPKKGYGYHGI